MSYGDRHEVENGKQPKAQPTNAGPPAFAEGVAAALSQVRQPEFRPENSTPEVVVALYEALAALVEPSIHIDIHTRQLNARAALAKARGEA